MFHNKVTGIKVAELIIQETGTYGQQYLRPYETNSNIDGSALDQLASKMVGNTANAILNPLAVVGSGGGFITRKAQPEAQLAIANGWDQRRIRFILKIVVDMQVSGSNTHIITGYTDFPGVSAATLSIAPEMIFYINSITKTRTVNHITPMGQIGNMNVVASQHVLYDNDAGSYNSPVHKRTMRPEDIYTTMGNSLLFNDPEFTNQGYDTRNVLRQTAVTADRNLSTPAHFITDVVNNYIHAAESENFGQDLNSIYTQAKARVMNEPNGAASYDDPFMTMLSHMRGGQPINGYFTWGELQRMDPNVSNVTNYMVIGHTEVNRLHQAGQTHHWGGSDRLTVAATLLSNAVPALMMELMITRVAFKSTNHNQNGRMETTILGGRGFSNLDMTMNYERFKDTFERLILSDLTYGNMIGYFIEMNVDLTGETWIKISLDSEPAVDFVTPSFCDGMFAPVITTNQQTVTNLSQDFNSLIESVQDRVKFNSKPVLTSFV